MLVFQSAILASTFQKKLLNCRVSEFRSRKETAPRLQSIFMISMELAFATKSLRSICESAEDARRKLGSAVSEKLKRRLADLRAAVSARDLIAGHPCELDGARQRRIALQLANGYRLLLCPNHSVPPKLESGKLDWAKVSRVKLLRIESGR